MGKLVRFFKSAAEAIIITGSVTGFGYLLIKALSPSEE